MNKAAIKRFAVWARTKLMADIRTRLGFVGITEDEVKAPLPSSTKEIQYFQGAGTEPVSVKGKNILARKDLAEKLQKDAKRSDYKTAYESLVETTASAWFNRLIAIRFMEVNDYLSDGIRMLSSAEAGKTDPDIVTAPFDSDLEFTEAEKEKIVQCKLNSETDRAFRILFFKRCHQLQEFLPGLFEKEGDATEFLMRLSVVDTDGVIYRLVHDIPEEDFRVSEGGQVEIIGWMYQYYNSELKDDTFAKLKKNIKVTKERIPSATQLFTPDWIVRYMVENSLGRLWIEHLRAKTSETDEKATAERFGWKYYLPEAKQEEAVEKQLAESRKERAGLKPEDIRCIDPCMGSGHILSYLFDVLMQIYEEEGYDARDAVEQIVTKNLYGLDIDDRAGQLAYFTVMMKAQQYDRGFFNRGIQPNVQPIQESNGCKTWAEVAGDSIVSGQLTLDDRYVQMADKLIETFHDAKEYGSLLTVKADDYGGLLDYIGQMEEQGSNNLLFSAWLEEVKENMAPLAKQAMLLSQKYDVVVTNPPYMGSSNMAAKLSAFVKKEYVNTKSDLSTAFMEKTLAMCKDSGYMAMINIPVWMFISSYEKMRKAILQKNTYSSMLHLGRGIFGSDFGTTAFVIFKQHIDNYISSYRRLFEKQGAVDSIDEKEKKFFSGQGAFVAQQENFTKIPGAPVAYWVSEAMLQCFGKETVKKYGFAGIGMRTGDNERFLRLWHEVATYNFSIANPSKIKWFPYNKGGNFRKWFGNNEYVVNWENGGEEIKENTRLVYPQLGDNLGWKISNEQYYFKKGITWTGVTMAKFSCRMYPKGFIFDSGANGLFAYKNNDEAYLAGFLNTKVANDILRIINPTVNTGAGTVNSVPIIMDKKQHEIISELVEKNFTLSKVDWDSFETSWDFKRHPLVQDVNALQAAYEAYKAETNARFDRLKANEEELNRIFIDIYGLQDELTPEVADKDVTVARIYDTKEEIPDSMKGNNYVLTKQDVVKSLISYAVGCMMGRYSLDVDGLAYAGGDFSEKWAGVSGQYYLRKVIAKYVCAELQRLDCLAESNGLGGGNLQDMQETPEGGNVCSFGSIETGSGFDTLEHCRRTRAQFSEGIYTVSINSKRFKSRSGNTTFDLCSLGVCESIGNGKAANALLRDWENADIIDWKTIHKSLVANHYSLTTEIIPICDEDYLDDDAVARFVEFVKVAYGEDTLEENLKFIADALGGNGSPREVIRNYFLTGFFADHVKTYKKRPIYWLFDSGKKNGFKALVYMHRWNKDTEARVRTFYLHKVQEKYENEVKAIDSMIEHMTDNRMIAREKKRMEKLKNQIAEIVDYDEVLDHIANEHIEIDLDDGVKVNYEKVQTDGKGKQYKILAPIK